MTIDVSRDWQFRASEKKCQSMPEHAWQTKITGFKKKKLTIDWMIEQEKIVFYRELTGLKFP